MMAEWEGTRVRSYKSYKAEKFNKYVERQKALVQGVKDSSLKDEDKKALLKQMLSIIEIFKD